jgi:predicted O-linked N-acetylglucosamine transferase (SPINDLY family)
MKLDSLSRLQDEAYRMYAAADAEGAQALCDKILEGNSKHAASHYLLSAIARDRGDNERALTCCQLACECDPKNPVFINALGELQALIGRVAEAEVNHRQAIALRPAYERAHHALGLLLQRKGNLEQAAQCFAEAVRLRPKYATAHNSLGAVLLGLQRLDDAERHLQKALELTPNYPEAHCNLGRVLEARGDFLRAAAQQERAIQLRPTYANAYYRLGRVLFALGRTQPSVALYDTAMRLTPDFAEAHLGLGNSLRLLGDLSRAMSCVDVVLRLRPSDASAFAERVQLKQQLCDFSEYESDLTRLWSDCEQAIAAGKPTAVTPWHSLSLPWSAARQLAIAKSHVQALTVLGSLNRPTAPKSSSTRLKLGYLSRDLNDHPVAHLFAEVVGLHDRGRFEVFVYSFGPDDHSEFRKKIEQGCEHFVELENLSFADTAKRIQADGISVLVDLMGHTAYARTAALALRAAPVQVTWLGYAGTMGADFIDYALVDSIVAPPETAADYVEKLARMPHCFFPALPGRDNGDRTFSRAEFQLPEAAIVLACFNRPFKISPVIFDAWMAILKRAPKAVLWLSVTHEGAQTNLQNEAKARGIDPNRLVFAGHLPSKTDHLARLRLADIFLDTLYYGAHVTACDALWAGLPVLTCPGGTFASRVGASLLTAIGLPELIAPNLDAYIAQAVSLANDPEQLQSLRKKLADQRQTMPLFDIAKFVAALEKVFEKLHADAT